MDFNNRDANFHYRPKELFEKKAPGRVKWKEEEPNRLRNLRYGLKWKKRMAVSKGSTSSST